MLWYVMCNFIYKEGDRVFSLMIYCVVDYVRSYFECIYRLGFVYFFDDSI